MKSLVQDIRYGWRTMRRSPGFAVAAVLTLAVAIGANAVVFSVMNGLILRPLSVLKAQSLYGIERASDKDMSQSYPDYLDLRDRNHSFDDLTAFSITQVALDTGESPSLIWAWRRAGTTLTHCGFSRISAVSSTAPMSVVRTALLISCSATHIGTAIFTMTEAWWAVRFS